MFTGLVEALGVVEANDPMQTAKLLVIRSPFASSSLARGESIAVNGCCLTVVEISHENSCITFAVSSATLGCTNLGELAAGSVVNLERALLFGARLGGHLVSGHVDCLATVLSWVEDGEFMQLRLGLDNPEARKLVIAKGSLCANGVSLTIKELSGEAALLVVEIMLIPETLRRSTFGSVKVGDKINIEFDLMGKYVAQNLASN